MHQTDIKNIELQLQDIYNRWNILINNKTLDYEKKIMEQNLLNWWQKKIFNQIINSLYICDEINLLCDENINFDST